MGSLCETLSTWAVPLLLLIIPVFGLLRGVRVYEAFVEGAAEGFQTAVRILPYLVAMLVAISVFRASGALELSVSSIRSLLDAAGIPPDLAPLAIIRPLSGTGALGLTTELMETQGPDSQIGRIASVMLGSTDTTFYILTVYFGAVGVTRPRYSVAAGLIGDLTGFIGAVYVTQLLFG